MLELAATLGVALVAVTVGVRLAGGGVGFEPALTVLILAPELYLPLRRLGAQFHASADGVAVAERVLDLLDAPAEVAAGGEPHPAEPGGGDRAPGGRSRSPTRRGPGRCSTASTWSSRRARPWPWSARAARARARWPRCCCASPSRRRAA